jgi:hypothetical protein
MRLKTGLPCLDAPAAPRYPLGMAREILSVADLRRAGTIDSVEIVAAITAYMNDPKSGPYRFASGHSLCVSEAMRAASGPDAMANRPGPQEKSQRVVVANAIMTARPTPPKVA